MAVFAIKYLRQFGFSVSNEPFRNHSWYFRNALVRANYNNYQQNIASTTVFLERFFENLLFNGQHELKDRFCHIRWDQEMKIQSAISKCQNVTLEERAILSILAKAPKTTQKQLAAEIKKSERTIKRMMDSLREKNLLFRQGSKRDGSWVLSDPKECGKNTKRGQPAAEYRSCR